MRLEKLFLYSCLVLVFMLGMGNRVQAAEGDDVALDSPESMFHRDGQDLQINDEIGDETAMQDMLNKESEQDAPPMLDDGSGEENEQDEVPVFDEADQLSDEIEQSDDEGMSDGEIAGLVAGSVAGAAVGAGAIAVGIKKYEDGKKTADSGFSNDLQSKVFEDDSTRLSNDEAFEKQEQKDDRAKKLGGLSKDGQAEFQKLIEEERAKGKIDVRKSGSEMDFEEKKGVVRAALESNAKAVVVDEEAEAKKQEKKIQNTEAKFRNLLRTDMRLEEEISQTKERIRKLKADIPEYDKEKQSISSSMQDNLDIEEKQLKKQEWESAKAKNSLDSFEKVISKEKRNEMQVEEADKYKALAEKRRSSDVQTYKRVVRANINVQENIDLNKDRIGGLQAKKKSTINPVKKKLLANKIKKEQGALRIKQDALFEAQKNLHHANETLKAKNISDDERKLFQQEEEKRAKLKKTQEMGRKKSWQKRFIPNARGIRRTPPSSTGVKM